MQRAGRTDDGIARATPASHRWGELEFHRLLEESPAGAYTCDPAGVITNYNQHAVGL